MSGVALSCCRRRERALGLRCLRASRGGWRHRGWCGWVCIRLFVRLWERLFIYDGWNGWDRDLGGGGGYIGFEMGGWWVDV